VRTVAAQAGRFPVRLKATGTVTPVESVDLRAQTTSTVAKVHVKEGDFVKAGQLLFTLDDRADRANVEKARAQLARDRATLADAERQLRRSQELVAQGFLSQSAVDTNQSQAQALQAALQTDEAALRAAEVQLSYTVIRAPISGRIGAIATQPGTLVLANTGAAPMLTITRMDPITVAFTVPETQLQQVLESGRQERLAVNASVNGSERSAQGQLTFIDNTVDPAVGGARAKASFENKDLQLWPGQSAVVQITLRTLENVTQVPVAALIPGIAGSSETAMSLYVVDAEGKAQLRKVDVLAQSADLAAVKGLDAGSAVVVDGKQNLRPGSRVRMAGADAAKAG
jgi:RND family efflux transporter MFP subunit